MQCKHWRSKQVGVGVVRELLGSMTALDAKAGSVVTSGRFTAEAERFAADQGLELLDGDTLRSLARTAFPAVTVEVPVPVGVSPPVVAENVTLGGALPSCPICARTMVERTAGRGPNVGSKFWGCPAYPGCRGTRDIWRRSSRAQA